MASTALSPLPLKDIADGPYHNPGDYIFSPLGLSLVSPTFQPRPYLDDFALKDGALCLDNWLQETSEGDNHSKQGTMDLLNAFDAASTRGTGAYALGLSLCEYKRMYRDARRGGERVKYSPPAGPSALSHFPNITNTPT